MNDDDWFKGCIVYKVESVKLSSRPKKSCDVVEFDLKHMNPRASNALDHMKWRNLK